MTTVRYIDDETTITYMQEFLPKLEADELFSFTRDNCSWRQDIFKVYTKEVLVPRLTSFYAETGVVYKYAGLTQTAEGMPEQLKSIMEKVIETSGMNFNSILLNYYRDERDSIGLHSDSERELGLDPVVAAISLGGTRRFDLVANKDKQIESFLVEHGSLIIMGPNCQNRWRHKIDKYTGSEPRISLTFRYIHG